MRDLIINRFSKAWANTVTLSVKLNPFVKKNCNRKEDAS